MRTKSHKTHNSMHSLIQHTQHMNMKFTHLLAKAEALYVYVCHYRPGHNTSRVTNKQKLQLSQEVLVSSDKNFIRYHTIQRNENNFCFDFFQRWFFGVFHVMKGYFTPYVGVVGGLNTTHVTPPLAKSLS